MRVESLDNVGRGLDPSLLFYDYRNTQNSPPRRGGARPARDRMVYNENKGLGCRGGIYAARCSRPGKSI